MKRYYLPLFLLVAVIAVLLVGLLFVKFETNTSQDPSTDSQLKIAATFFPLAEIARNVAPSSLVTPIIPAGVEPHDYEPSTGDITKFSSADVFVTMGMEFSEIENKISQTNSKIKTINSATNINLLAASGEEAEEGELYDPHIWVSPKNMIIMTKNTVDQLSEIDAQNANTYQQNAQNYIKQLNEIDQQYQTQLKNCKKDTIMVSHNAFSYLAKDYNFKILYIAGLSPEVEPSANQLASLINKAKTHNLKYIFYEELVDPKIANTIADAAGATSLELNPAEGSKDNKSYIQIMKNNLKNLKIALECN